MSTEKPHRASEKETQSPREQLKHTHESVPEELIEVQPALRSVIEETHEQLNNSLPFHGVDHIKNVLLGVEETFEAWGIGADDRGRVIASIAALGHDLVQVSVLLPHGERFRLAGWGVAEVRARIDAKARVLGQDATQFERYVYEQLRAQGIDKEFEGNEKESAILVRKIVEESGTELGLAEDAREDFWRRVFEAIESTVPHATFGPRADLPPILDPATGMHVEPTSVPRNEDGIPEILYIDQILKPDSSPETLAVAMNDLFIVGRSRYEDFQKTGNNEFWEINQLLKEELSKDAFDEMDLDRLKSAFGVKTPAEVYATIVKKALAWVDGQVGFAWGQKARFVALCNDTELLRTHGLRVQDLHTQFTQFDKNIIAADHDAQECRKSYSLLCDPRAFATGEDVVDRASLQDLQLLLNDRMGLHPPVQLE